MSGPLFTAQFQKNWSMLNYCGIRCNVRAAMQDQTHTDSDCGKYFGKSLKIGQVCSNASPALSPSLQEVQMTSYKEVRSLSVLVVNVLWVFFPSTNLYVHFLKPCELLPSLSKCVKKVLLLLGKCHLFIPFIAHTCVRRKSEKVLPTNFLSVTHNLQIVFCSPSHLFSSLRSLLNCSS